MKPLEDIVVLDFSQFLSGPSATLRLADMGATVIKIERPEGGDICRQLYVSDVMIEGESTIFHAINRNKQSYAADLKNPDDLAKIKLLLQQADVMLHNFRPGVIERLGLSYEVVKAINPGIVYAEISGYGSDGDWKHLPGQDLLLQSVSGLTWLTNNQNESPTPMGVSVADILAGAHISQAILAALYKKAISGQGSQVSVSMLESVMNFQFELITCFYNDGNELPVRSAVNNGNAYLQAPYGIYATQEGFLALAMGDIVQLGNILDCTALSAYTNAADWFTLRDEIKSHLADHLITKDAAYWLGKLQAAGYWAAKVFNYDQLTEHEGYKAINMELFVNTSNGLQIKTTRCPIKIDGEILLATKGAPLLGEHTDAINNKYLAQNEVLS
ncbi:CaiB/BaiF CoA transferase family protein [Polluticaenibacter yanchengensis]|uniref:CaiB/BaiF CoA-transferase family protein n=1 Tax=Polluticaenibacter yanchengensis TaxID=3014562 RepID=A0ABT4UEM4_9BACT|nr:CaiB/BaiF CoA-transferase family protein [Chitinophagaceae bacterium LY-5]